MPIEPGRPLLAFDVGGTRIKYGLVGLDGRVLRSGSCDTQGDAGSGRLLQRLCTLAQEMAPGRPQGIAVSTLGIVDPQDGRIVAGADAIAGYAGFPLREQLQRCSGLPVEVENDVNCVALAEGWLGAARDWRNYLAVTLGTGIGGGIVVGRQLMRGRGGWTGEWGYWEIDGGVWEDTGSLRGLARLARAAQPQRAWTARQVYEAHDAGQAWAQPVVAQWLDVLALGLVNLVYAFDPEGLVIGGGICARGPRFVGELGGAMTARLRADFAPLCPLRLADTGNHAGMLGAAMHWQQRQRA